MSLLPRFDAPYAEADEAIATRLLAGAALPAAAEARIDARARRSSAPSARSRAGSAASRIFCANIR